MNTPHLLRKGDAVDDGYATLALCVTRILKAKHVALDTAHLDINLCGGCVECLEAGDEFEPDQFVIDEWEAA